jgi:hypothetical protein
MTELFLSLILILLKLTAMGATEQLLEGTSGRLRQMGQYITPTKVESLS